MKVFHLSCLFKAQNNPHRLFIFCDDLVNTNTLDDASIMNDFLTDLLTYKYEPEHIVNKLLNLPLSIVELIPQSCPILFRRLYDAGLTHKISEKLKGY